LLAKDFLVSPVNINVQLALAKNLVLVLDGILLINPFNLRKNKFNLKKKSVKVLRLKFKL